MFKIGDYVIHGSNGACRVDRIGPLSGVSTTGEKEYYTLTTCYSNSTIYSPVDSTKVLLRPIMTRPEAEKLIAEMKDIPELGEIAASHWNESSKAALILDDVAPHGDVEKWMFLKWAFR